MHLNRRSRMMYRGLAAALAVVLAAITLGASPAAAGGGISPAQYMEVYYDYVNYQNYPIAYAQWDNPTQTYDQFVAGYADTAFVQTAFGTFQAGPVNSLQGGVPAVLYSQRHDGTVAAYSGCYYLRYTGGANAGVDLWQIAGADIQPLGYIPAYETWQGLADGIQCTPRTTSLGDYYNVQSLLGAYYDAINRRDFATAYGLWLNPPQTYNQFVNGFGDTTEVAMFYGAYQFSGVYNAYETGRVPVMLLGYRTDGSMVAYQGCFRLNFTATRLPSWSIIGANLVEIPTTAAPPSAYTAQQALGAACY